MESENSSIIDSILFLKVSPRADIFTLFVLLSLLLLPILELSMYSSMALRILSSLFEVQSATLYPKTILEILLTTFKSS